MPETESTRSAENGSPRCALPYMHGPHVVDNGLLQVDCPGAARVPLGFPRTCCHTVTGESHRSCPIFGVNEHGVAMCDCKPFGRAHAWEPGESCNPTRAIPNAPIFGDTTEAQR